jgi:small subunit ribosomal protein S2
VKLSRNLEGIKQMGRLPGALFVVDAKKEKIAVSEANKLGIPVIAIADTNADPDTLTVPIAGNDDAIRSVELITKAIADTIAEARREAPVREESDDVGEGAMTYSSERGTEAAGDRGGDERRRRRPRRRRAKPEAIAAHLKGADAEGESGDAAPDAGDE